MNTATAWNLAALRIAAKTRPARETAILEIIHSIDRYDSIFRFHLFGARDAMKGVIHAGPGSEMSNLSLILRNSDRQDDFDTAKIASEAHILGCIHTTRALFDVFANLVNELLLNRSVPIGRCDVRVATAALAPSALKSTLEDILSSDWFDYISAFVNTAKHRQLVKHAFHVSFVGEDAGIRIEPFDYNGRSFPGYTDQEILAGILEVKNRILDCGRALNAEVMN
jgi:hypothetical protein